MMRWTFLGDNRYRSYERCLCTIPAQAWFYLEYDGQLDPGVRKYHTRNAEGIAELWGRGWMVFHD